MQDNYKFYSCLFENIRENFFDIFNNPELLKLKGFKNIFESVIEINNILTKGTKVPISKFEELNKMIFNFVNTNKNGNAMNYYQCIADAYNFFANLE